MKNIIILIIVYFTVIACGESVTGQYSDDTDTENYSTDTTATDYSSDEVVDTDTISLPGDSDSFDLEAYNTEFDCLAGETPEDICLNGNVINFTGEYTIVDGKCNFSFETETCDEGCVEANYNMNYPHCYTECDNYTPEEMSEESGIPVTGNTCNGDGNISKAHIACMFYDETVHFYLETDYDDNYNTFIIEDCLESCDMNNGTPVCDLNP